MVFYDGNMEYLKTGIPDRDYRIWWNRNPCGVIPVAFLKYLTKWEGSENFKAKAISLTVRSVCNK